MLLREIAVYPKDNRVMVTFVTRGGRQFFVWRDSNNFWLKELYYQVFRKVTWKRGILLPHISTCGWTYTEKEKCNG